MNPKQTVPIVTTLAPIIAAAPGLLIIGGLVALAAWLLSGEDKKKPENAPEKAAPSRPPLQNPPNSAGKPTLTPAPSIPAPATSPASSIPAVPRIPVLPPLTYASHRRELRR